MDKERKLVGRIHRLEGQVRALERVLGRDSELSVITQFEAIISAAKASLVEYIDIALSNERLTMAEKQKIIARLIKQG